MSRHADINCIRAFVMDVDGVLTDGGIGYGCGSDDEIKFFNVKDGLGLSVLKRLGITCAVISGRRSRANQRRLLEELKIPHVLEGCATKADGLRQFCGGLGIEPAQCIYVGDDLIDIAPMRMAGLAVAVGDAVDEVKAEADWVTEANGGHGAIREVIERFLKAVGRWDEALAFYRGV